MLSCIVGPVYEPFSKVMLHPDACWVACHAQIVAALARNDADVLAALRRSPVSDITSLTYVPSRDEWLETLRVRGMHELVHRDAFATALLSLGTMQAIEAALGSVVTSQSPTKELLSCLRHHLARHRGPAIATSAAAAREGEESLDYDDEDNNGTASMPVEMDPSAVHSLLLQWIESAKKALPVVTFFRGPSGLPILDVSENEACVLQLGGGDAESWRMSPALWLEHIDDVVHTHYGSCLRYRAQPDAVPRLVEKSAVQGLIESIFRRILDLGVLSSEHDLADAAAAIGSAHPDVAAVVWVVGPTTFVASRAAAVEQCTTSLRAWTVNRAALMESKFMQHTAAPLSPPSRTGAAESLMATLSASGIWFEVQRRPDAQSAALSTLSSIDGSVCMPWSPPPEIATRVTRDVMVFVPTGTRVPQSRDPSADDWSALFAAKKLPPEVMEALSMCETRIACSAQTTTWQQAVFERMDQIVCPPNSSLHVMHAPPPAVPVATKGTLAWMRIGAAAVPAVMQNPSTSWMTWRPSPTGQLHVTAQKWIAGALGRLPSGVGRRITARIVSASKDNPDYASIALLPGVCALHVLPARLEDRAAPAITDSEAARHYECAAAASTCVAVVSSRYIGVTHSVVPGELVIALGETAAPPGAETPWPWVVSVGAIPMPLLATKAKVFVAVFGPTKWPGQPSAQCPEMGIAETRLVTMMNRRFVGESLRFLWDVRSKVPLATWNYLRQMNDLAPVKAGMPAPYYRGLEVEESIRKHQAAYHRVSPWRPVDAPPMFIGSSNWRGVAINAIDNRALATHAQIVLALVVDGDCVLFSDMGIATSESATADVVVSEPAVDITDGDFSVPISASLCISIKPGYSPPAAAPQPVDTDKAWPPLPKLHWESNTGYVPSSVKSTFERRGRSRDRKPAVAEKDDASDEMESSQAQAAAPHFKTMDPLFVVLANA